MIEVPAVVRNKARAAGAEDWLERLPALVSSLEADWSITVGHPYEGGTEAFVADATRADGTPAVLKVLVPGTGSDASSEAAVLRLVGGDGCPVLYRHDPDQGALLMERLGRPMYELGLPLARRLAILCATATTFCRSDECKRLGAGVSVSGVGGRGERGQAWPVRAVAASCGRVVRGCSGSWVAAGCPPCE
jgi:streptomycin 6-kinase